MSIGASRSAVLVMLVASSFVFWQRRKQKFNRDSLGIGTRRKIVLGLLALTTMSLVYFGYIYAAPAGYLGKVSLSEPSLPAAATKIQP